MVLDASEHRPTATQWAFLRDRTRLRALIGGVGSGKTHTGAEAALEAAIENPGADGMLVSPTFSMLWRTLIPAWERACPEQLRKHIKKERRYVLWHGGSVWYGTAEVPESLEGTNLAWYWGDEARYWPVQSHRNMLSRLRLKSARRPQAFYTTTPAMGWLSDEFNSDRPGRAAYRISTRENAANLADDYIENLERTLSARMARSIIDGEFSVIDGQVYEEFDEARHVIDWQHDPRLPLWASWDFGVRQSAIIFAQPVGPFGATTRDGKRLPPHSLVVVDEIMPEQTPTARQIPLVQAALAQRFGGRALDRIVCDPAGNQRSQDTGLRSVTMLQDAFGPIVRYETEIQERDIPTRIGRVQGALAPVEGEPTLYVARDLARQNTRRGVVKALRSAVYPEREGRRLSDRPREDETEHARDVLEYLVVRWQNESKHAGAPQRTRVVWGGR